MCKKNNKTNNQKNNKQHNVIIVDGDRAAMISEVNTVQRTTGRTLNSRIAGYHRIAEGKHIEYRGFTDSFDAVEQMLGREVQL